MPPEPRRTVRDHLSEFVERVEHEHELDETIDVLRDAEALADIREADQAYQRGDVVRGVQAVRQLRTR